ncbi:30S ribosomal protein S8 [Engelhardtia mirabilis]|uniref:Small ribosomal subunit protein uS8 n=1 Tax=Engelhardtia mirabilis TaxID=2528011 RepID=A0A518BPE1_9BACT|nr:30S ribosomal protein S8 [Planctomycetes bacterium Pla133]QDV03153.1 30S ribosomal protein S8 [Planctomycetes bacterium Pla86]
MMTDPIADMLTRIRNANSNRAAQTKMPASRMKVGIAEALKAEGFIDGYEVQPATPSSTLVINLKYGPDGERVIRAIDRVSKPGCRKYRGARDIPRVVRGLGIYVLSTPKGIVSDRTARRENVGGEVLCKVY